MSEQTITIQRPDEAELRAEYAPLVLRAESMTIATKDDHEAAQLYLVDLKRAEKAVGEKLDPIVKQANATHKMLTALRSAALAPIESARGIISRKVSDYERDQARIAAEAQRKAEAEARAREEARRQAEQEAALAAAAEAEAAGDNDLACELLDEAEAIEDDPVFVPVVAVPVQTARVNGVSTQTRWSASVTDKAALVAYVAAHPEWLHLLDVAMPALNGLARSQRDALRIPGVRAVAETVHAVRG